MSPRRRSRKLAAVAAAAGIGAGAQVVTAGPAAAHHDPAANTFGSQNGVADSDNILLGDLYIQEWSVWDNWAPIASADFDNYINSSLEAVYDNQTDLVINKGARYTSQDVAYFSAYGSGDITLCNLQTAAIYGSHPHRVCDHKVIWIDLNDWNSFTSVQRKYLAAHEFGHEVGLRHSNAGLGIDNAGNTEARVHPDPDGTVMHTYGFGTYALVAAEINNINMHY